MTQARGEIIAVTEDHCQVTLGWCERIIQAHKDYPDAAAIGGAVENGRGEHLIDWANFFLIFAPFMLPIQNGESARICLQANISYKRRVLPQSVSKLGMMEMLFNQRLRQQREKLVNDEKLIVYHVQSHGFLGTLAAHFHNGRSIAGFRLQYIRWPERIVRLGGSFVLPLYLLWRTLRAILENRRLLGQALACGCAFRW
jgi:hypothetical protein